ncbi:MULTISPECIES: phosphoglucosamine mutase [Dietzia]|jgi:phosphoglucosamine mutase|uniref:Phosphoglucosamine mutase n=1 Tax=Dietzia maris TaxID=37915 RepID=A0ABT8H3Q5_9ACTN|nr:MULTISPECIES: phosphoglucosamine mutase [Dietzia]ODQ84734.1 phosphoglucosamine mutase [Dietzia alimentaria]MBB0995981.1 phosphoglucosamine mutase [Dietzia maris]MBB1018094.1 phosphoglucosamine mutase [Dietzia sp. DQ11-71]MDN4507090.1 phosphoglucosamine mutase [Dietzia maris]MDV3356282.1 phosphoglucosamine mutase [Dietzia sp. IN118]
MTRLFGTDGVRGLANRTLTVDLAVRLGAAAAAVLATEVEPSPRRAESRPVAVVGRDPRVSGEMLEAALAAGLASQGVDVLLVGELPTPAVAHLTAQHEAELGAVISASHNAMPDNGIKFFAAGGHKLADEVEDRVEAALTDGAITGPTGSAIGRISRATQEDALDGYVRHLLDATPGRLDGLVVVVDCANGAASAAAPRAYREAGATVIEIHASPDGYNINDNCGSTHLDDVRAAVRAHGADLGLAHDGDADRCLAIDASGEVVDGDQIMAILALAMRDSGELVGNTLVATIMSNLGLKVAMREAGIEITETKVGDRYVLERLREGGYSLGGEQSGHLVLPAHATTGDGVLTGLRLMARMAETGKSLAELAGVMTVLPQVLVNVPVEDKAAVVASGAVCDAVVGEERRLGSTGRVLLRPSGTEQLVRVMVEAEDANLAGEVAERLAGVVAAV